MSFLLNVDDGVVPNLNVYLNPFHIKSGKIYLSKYFEQEVSGGREMEAKHAPVGA